MVIDIKSEFKGVISVIGASEIDKRIEEITFEMGRLLAKNGFIVACGGLSGVMEAVCRGVKEENGLTIGIIPHTEKTMANKIKTIKNTGKRKHELDITEFFGGKEKGEMIQITQGLGGDLDEPGFIQLTQRDTYLIIIELTKWLQKNA